MRIKNIKALGKSRVVNLNVVKNHTFFTENGICVKNCENLSQNSLQSIKTTIESFTNVSFIFTANMINKIPEPVRNRMIHFDFDEIFFKNKAQITKGIIKRLSFILNNENIQYDKETLIHIIKTFYPSARGMIGALQRFSSNGKLEINDSIKENGNINNLIVLSLKEKNFKEMRELITKVIDCCGFYEFLFKNLDLIQDESKPEAILILAKYQDMDYCARDKMITLGACCVELMSKIKFL